MKYKSKLTEKTESTLDDHLLVLFHKALGVIFVIVVILIVLKAVINLLGNVG